MKSEEEYIKEFRALETAKIRTKLIDALSKDPDDSKTCILKVWSYFYIYQLKLY